MKKWTEYLENEVYQRLANCRTISSDVEKLVNAKFMSYKENGKIEKGYTKEDALIEILDLLDCNNVFIDLSREDYDRIISV